MLVHAAVKLYAALLSIFGYPWSSTRDGQEGVVVVDDTWERSSRTSFDAGGLHVELYDNVFTVSSLNVSTGAYEAWSNANNFSFVPQNNPPSRGCHNFGDLTFRVRPVGFEAWGFFSSAAANGTITAAEVKQEDNDQQFSGVRSSDVIISHDITALIEQDISKSIKPFGDHSPLRVIRSWKRVTSSTRASKGITSNAILNTKSGLDVDKAGEYLVLQFDLTNHYTLPIEIGGLGFSMPAAGPPQADTVNIQQAVWNDPHIGQDHGWVEWVRIVDDERLLLAVPEFSISTTRINSSNRTLDDYQISKFEAWRPILENTCGNSIWEYTVFSKAWAEEWQFSRQFPFLYMAGFLNETKMWPNPKTPWPAWHSHETVPVTDHSARSGFSETYNTPTSITLAPGQTVSSAVKLILARGGPRTRDEAIKKANAIALIKAEPGFVLSPSMKSARLLVRPPSGVKITDVSSSNTDILRPNCGSLSVTSTGFIRLAGSGWYEICLDVGASSKGLRFGKRHQRARIEISFSDASVSSSHFVITGTSTFEDLIERLAQHYSMRAWLRRDHPDAFGRGASVVPWDRESKSQVLDDSRAYDVGLSDDAGGGNPLGLATIVAFKPGIIEVSRVDDFIKYTLYGTKKGLKECTCFDHLSLRQMPCDCAKPPYKSLQIRPQDLEDGVSNDLDGIRMTLYYYYYLPNDPGNSSSPTHVSRNSSGHFSYYYVEADKCTLPGIEGGPNWCMDEKLSNATYRLWNYPHHTASYYSLYKTARNHRVLAETLHHDWEWYLARAANTTLRFGSPGVGVMDGTIFREVLLALKEESAWQDRNFPGMENQWTGFAEAIEGNMIARARIFNVSKYPYASEYPFGTTSQEEVVVWLLEYAGKASAGDEHFSFELAANRTVSHTLSFMRSSPTWPYHGGTRR